MPRLLSYGNENDNGYDKHLRSQTDLLITVLPFGRKIGHKIIVNKIRDRTTGDKILILRGKVT